MARRSVIRRRTLRVEQHSDVPVYLLALTADELLQIAEISRVSRNQRGKLTGYQRPEVRRHIRNITEYLNGDSVIFPNSIILALSSDVQFRRSRGPQVDEGFASAGVLELPVPVNGDAKPAWVVDGQQRLMALSKSKRRDFPVPVNAFVADDLSVQREQFLRINSTKPLPRGLITELLPSVKTVLPANLAVRRAPSELCDLLNQDPSSPFHRLIRRPSLPAAARKAAVVNDTAIVKMLEDSLTTPSGCLFPYRNVATGETDYESVQRLLYLYWGAVRDTFPEAWGRDPRESRLMHGAGIRAMGRLMDRIMAAADIQNRKAASNIRKELGRVRSACHWTSGTWTELGGLRWNDIQNTPSHIGMLSNHLLRSYMDAQRAKA